jgi:Abortive infection C-terminus
MTSEAYSFQLSACRELMESHPESLVIRQQVEALEDAMPDKPGIAISFCRTLIETTCKTILSERGKTFDNAWKADKLWLETKDCLNLGQHHDGQLDRRLHNATEKIVSGFNSIFEGIITIRNDHGTASHGAEAYAPLLDVRYAEMLARSTDAIIGLLFKLHLNALGSSRDTRKRYEDEELREFNQRIDADFGPFEVLETPLLASEALFKTDQNAYRAALVQFLQEQQNTAVDAAQGAEAEGT